MKLKMLQTCLGSPDGRRVVEYLKGESYDLPADLAEAFVAQGWARAFEVRVGVRVLRDPFSAKPFVLFYTTKRTGGDVTNFEAAVILKTAA